MSESILPWPLREALYALRPTLEALARADLPDAWLGAGAIRNRVWSSVLGDGGPPDRDWDVAFAGDVDQTDAEARLAAQLRGPWEAIDQRRFGHASAAEGIASWPETATAIGARLSGGVVELLAPWGIDDLIEGKVRRAPRFSDEGAFRERLRNKRWALRWPALVEAPFRDGEPTLQPIRVDSRVEPAVRVLRAEDLPHELARSARSGEVFGSVAQISELAGLTHLRVHHERLAPGRRASRPHHHTTREEGVYVLSGVLVLDVGGIETRLAAGDFVALPAGPPVHVVRNEGSVDAEMLVLSAAPGLDRVVYAP